MFKRKDGKVMTWGRPAVGSWGKGAAGRFGVRPENIHKQQATDLNIPDFRQG